MYKEVDCDTRTRARPVLVVRHQRQEGQLEICQEGLELYRTLVVDARRFVCTYFVRIRT